MGWYYYLALVLILSQLLFIVQVYRNYRYALNKYKRKRSGYRPRTALIIPCKGLDSDFDRNIASFFNQDYENYLLWFVVADESDQAYGPLCRLKDEIGQGSKARDVRIWVAGQGQSCSQKIHNLLYCCQRITEDVEVLVFADSDACVGGNWLSHIVYPLRQPKNGVASGYRWFVPEHNNLASLALSAVNAKVAQLLGNSPFNQAWGGSMAVRVDVFRRLGIDRIWSNALSDDLLLTCAIKKAGLKVAFVPACLVATHHSSTWREFFEFGRRQFVITRVVAPKIWWAGLSANLYSVLGLWATAALAVYAVTTEKNNTALFAAVPILFFVGQLVRAILRQTMVGKLLNKETAKMKPAMAADILLFWIWSLLLLYLIVSSAFGRTICWRGIRYKLLSATETVRQTDCNK